MSIILLIQSNLHNLHFHHPVAAPGEKTGEAANIYHYLPASRGLEAVNDRPTQTKFVSVKHWYGLLLIVYVSIKQKRKLWQCILLYNLIQHIGKAFQIFDLILHMVETLRHREMTMGIRLSRGIPIFEMLLRTSEFKKTCSFAVLSGNPEKAFPPNCTSSGGADLCTSGLFRRR